uniref:G_PROTEIN_RECEP_F1_2 domain-containing protein n=1 Tax=Macrostomum lignano TaxID=282301 RepID=A0A1I8GR39_9PLAT
MDTFLCNLVFLHCLGCAIDTWLRLRYPMSYSHSTGKGSTCLKISAPWSVSFIQTTAEFAVSKQYEELYDAAGGACLHRDPNFVILRACMSYGLPGLASLVLLLLAFRQFAALRRSDGNAEAATAGLMEAEASRRRRWSQRRRLQQQQMQQHDAS